MHTLKRARLFSVEKRFTVSSWQEKLGIEKTTGPARSSQLSSVRMMCSVVFGVVRLCNSAGPYERNTGSHYTTLKVDGVGPRERDTKLNRWGKDTSEAASSV